MKVYRIKNVDGLYSMGGTRIRFTKNGKVWSTLGHVKCHLAQWKKNLPKEYESCIVEEYELSPTGSITILGHQLKHLSFSFEIAAS